MRYVDDVKDGRAKSSQWDWIVYITVWNIQNLTFLFYILYFQFLLQEHHMERIVEMQNLEDPNRLDNMAVQEKLGNFNI